MKKEKFKLSQEDIVFYKKYGYLLLKNVFTEEEALSTVRISFGKIHTKNDVEYVAKQLSIILERLKK